MARSKRPRSIEQALQRAGFDRNRDEWTRFVGPLELVVADAEDRMYPPELDQPVALIVRTEGSDVEVALTFPDLQTLLDHLEISNPEGPIG